MDLLLPWQTLLNLRFGSPQHERFQYLMELSYHLNVFLLGLSLICLGIC